MSVSMARGARVSSKPRCAVEAVGLEAGRCVDPDVAA